MDIKNVKDVIKKTADGGKTVADTSRKTKDNLSKTTVFISVAKWFGVKMTEEIENLNEREEG